jgi:hypothetical protein
VDEARFDQLTQFVAASRSRRDIVRVAIGSALGGLIGLCRRGDEVEAARRCRDEGHPCEGNQACCDGLVCTAGGEGRVRRCRRCPAGQVACGDRCSDGCTESDACGPGGPVSCGPCQRCDPAHGTCRPDEDLGGESCPGDDKCFARHVCRDGQCVGVDPVVCDPPDACHGPGTCLPATGSCSYPDLPDGTPCGDGNACLTGASCRGGVCQAGTTVDCSTDNPCLTARCDPVRGCVTTPKGAGTSCDDGDVCNGTRTCDGAGECRPGTPVTCAPCRRCNPVSGACEADLDQDGAVCPGDGNPCFGGFRCADGLCVGVDERQCAPLDDCHRTGACQPETGQCTNPNAPDGTICAAGPNRTGTCTAGQCRAECDAGHAECASQTEAGCLTDILTDPRNCGGCAESGGRVCAADERCVAGVCVPGGSADAVCLAAVDGCSFGASRCDDGSQGNCYCLTSTEDVPRCVSLRTLDCAATCATSAECPGTPRPDGEGTFGPDAFCARVDGCCDPGVAVCMDPCPSYCAVECACPQSCVGSSCLGPGLQVPGELTAASPTFQRCRGDGSSYAYVVDTYNHPGGALSINARGAASGGGTLDDTVLYLYSAFDPADPCAGLAATNDDNGCSLESRIAGTFPAGTYTVVLTTFQDGVAGSYTLEYNRCSPCHR